MSRSKIYRISKNSKNPFINTEFESGRHETRVNQILELEKKY